MKRLDAALIEIRTGNPVLDITLAMYLQSMEMVRHYDNQRAAFTTIMVAIVVGLFTAVAYFSNSEEPLDFQVGVPIIAVMLGFIGLFVMSKMGERSRMHVHRERMLRQQIDELIPQANIGDIFDDSYRAQRRRFRYLTALSQGRMWAALYWLIILCGLISLLLVLDAKDVVHWLRSIALHGGHVVDGVKRLI